MAYIFLGSAARLNSVLQTHGGWCFFPTLVWLVRRSLAVKGQKIGLRSAVWFCVIIVGGKTCVIFDGVHMKQLHIDLPSVLASWLFPLKK